MSMDLEDVGPLVCHTVFKGLISKGIRVLKYL